MRYILMGSPDFGSEECPSTVCPSAGTGRWGEPVAVLPDSFIPMARLKWGFERLQRSKQRREVHAAGSPFLIRLAPTSLSRATADTT